MALSYAKLLCRRNFDLGYLRGLYTISGSGVYTVPKTPAIRLGSTTTCESYEEKNQRLKRPMSPHLTIYQVQLTSLLSITHRTTGMILASYAMVLGLGTLFLPGGIPCLIDSIQALHLPTSVLFIGKTLIALPATYHTFNGLRHLAWDLGKFLTIKQVYTTGYVVVALSTISALFLAVCSLK